MLPSRFSPLQQPLSPFQEFGHRFCQPFLLNAAPCQPPVLSQVVPPSAAVAALELLLALGCQNQRAPPRLSSCAAASPEAEGDKGRGKAGLCTRRALAGKAAPIARCQSSCNPRKNCVGCGKGTRLLLEKKLRTESPGTGSGSCQLAPASLHTQLASTQVGRRDGRCCRCFADSPLTAAERRGARPG